MSHRVAAFSRQENETLGFLGAAGDLVHFGAQLREQCGCPWSSEHPTGESCREACGRRVTAAAGQAFTHRDRHPAGLFTLSSRQWRMCAGVDASGFWCDVWC